MSTSSLVPTVITREFAQRPFDIQRIENAIAKASASTVPTKLTPAELARKVHREILRLWPTSIYIEEIQDIVERVLMQEGETEVARHYILYRAEHAAQREKRDVPPEVRAAFDESAKYFPTAIQQFQFFDKYSRYDETLGRRETWVETVDRTMSFLRELVSDQVDRTKGSEKPASGLDEQTWHEIRQGILEMRVMPSMRLLAMAGPAARRQNLSLYNCFSGDTEFVTSKGLRRLDDTVGQLIEVMTKSGEWSTASVQSFGVQPVNEVTLRYKINHSGLGNFFHTVHVTPNHRWILADGTETTDLKVGERLISPFFEQKTTNLEAIRHGFVFGDGTISYPDGKTSQGYVMVRLCGEKKRGLLNWLFDGFKHSYPPSNNGDPVVYCGKNTRWKSLPQTEDADYIAGFIYGWMLADGHRTSGRKSGPTDNYRIDTQNQEAASWLLRFAALAGYKVLTHHIYDGATNFGKRSAPLHQILIGNGETAYLQVVSIKPIEDTEVFCVVEPKTHTFMLSNGQITGNCSAVGVDSLDTFVEALLISMAGCGVGFSVERRFVDKLPTIAHSTIAKNEEAVVHYEGASDNWPVYSVEDTTEGWADALRIGLETWFSGQDVSFDFSLVRPAGSVLKTKGGRASGPEPLRKLLQEIRWIIIRRRGQKLRPIDAHDIMCHVGSAAVSGGTRRTAMISLFDHDDYAMLHAKDGDLTKQPQRWNANNSAVWPDRGITQRELLEQMLTMDKAGTGEPGIFNRKALQLTQPKHRETRDFLTNPCGEIVLRPDGGLCNLSICVARPDDTYQTLAEKVRLATIIGTIQSLATKFPGMRPIWRKNAEEERLLGVDITGQRDCEATADPIVMGALRGVVYDTNLEMAERFGIKQAASTTCVKPSGNSSVLLNSSSGIHARWAPYYVRNVRVGTKSPIYQVLKDAGVPMQPEVGQTAENAITWVASFPVKSPEGAITRSDLSALEQCNYWLHNKKNWTTHNPSVTITYRPDELLDVIAWVWENRNVVGGMSFLPRDDAQYDLMPYQEISKETYEQMMATFPTIDFSKMYRYEQSDTSTASSELSCFAGQCEIA